MDEAQREPDYEDDVKPEEGPGQTNHTIPTMRVVGGRRISSDMDRARARLDADVENAAEGLEAAGDRLRLVREDARQYLDAGLETAKQRMDQGIARTAERLDAAAGRLRESGDGSPSEATLLLADDLEIGAAYLKARTSEDIVKDAEAFIKRHPVKTMLAVLIAGVIAGRIMR